MRAKLFGAMAVLVFFMGMAYFLSTQGYLRSHLPNLVSAAEEAKTQSWIQAFQAYYMEHGKSWTGIERKFQAVPKSGDDSFSLDVALFTPYGKFIYQAAGNSSEAAMRKGLSEAVIVDGRMVGKLYFYNQELARIVQLQDSIYMNMFHLTFKVIIGLSFISLVIGLWLSRVLTRPLRQLILALQRVGKGDLRVSLPVARGEYGQVAAALNSMAADLARSEDVRKHLVADVAHELRTPLAILQGKLELIQQNGQVIEPISLLPMQDEVLRLNRVVNDLLQLSLAEAGRLSLEKKETDMTVLLKHLLDIFQLEAEEKGTSLQITSFPEEMSLVVDPHRLTQVFYNIIGNAIRHTLPGGQIAIHLSKKQSAYGEICMIQIKDDGVGIEQEHLPHLFDRFYRAGEDRSRQSGGMGLGLAIAKQFVEAHGGEITVESSPGKGTVFTVYLP
jgi:two-component system sensor histidine kinase BaeS